MAAVPAKVIDQYLPVERARRVLCYEAWNIGVVDQPAADIVERGIVSPVRWLPPPPPGVALADPSVRQRADGARTMYAEHIDYRAPVGSIWSADLGAGAAQAAGRGRPLLTRGFHMSYPFPFEDEEGRTLLTAETWEADAALLWLDDGGLHPIGTLMEGRPVLDPTLWRAADRWWLFCTFRDDAPNERLHLFHAPGLDGPWTPHARNPVKTGRDGSRPAGPLFLAGGTLVRPGQDCSRTYGGAVILHAVTRLDEGGYEEEPLRVLAAPPGHYPHGLHTFCPAGDATLIDGKRWKTHPAVLLRKVLRKLSRT